MVLFYHCHTVFGGWQWFARGYLAVDFFFTLSGFVMARTYGSDLRNGAMAPNSFLVARYKRLWAPIAVGTILGIFYQTLAKEQVTTISLILGLLLIPDLTTEKPYTLNRPAWSIFFELFANAIHAIILRKSNVAILSAVSFVSLVWLFFVSLPFDAIAVGFRSADFHNGIARVMASYCLGMVIAKIRPSDISVPWLATAMLTAILLLLPIGVLWDLLFVAILAPVLVIVGANDFGGRVGAILGALSFPLYAVHFPIFQIGTHFQIAEALTLFTTFITAGAVAIWIDKRLLALLSRLTSRNCR